MQIGKLTIPARAQLTSSHVDIEDNVAFPIAIYDAVVGYAVGRERTGEISGKERQLLAQRLT